VTRVLLLVPPAPTVVIRDYYCSKTSQAHYLHPPLDLVVQGGWLRAAGCEVTLVDATVDRLDAEAALARVVAARPDAVLALAGAVSWPTDGPFLERVAARTGAPVHVSGDLFMEDDHHPLEGRPFLAGALRDLTSGDLAREVKGRPREDGALLLAGEPASPRARARGRASIPPPAHDLFVGRPYRYPMARRYPIATSVIGYGCPYTCSFCIMGELGTSVRAADEVVAEFEQLAGLGAREVFLQDQCLGAPRGPYLEVLEALAAARLDVGWWAFTRVDVLDETLARRLRAAGCHTVILGVESASDEILANNRKGYGRQRVREAFALCERVGLRTAATFILGLPEETAETARRTIEFACSLPADYASFNVAVPRAGTRLRREAVADGRVDADLVVMDQSGTEPVLATRGLSPRELRAWRRRAVLSFYLRPAYLARRLRRVTSPAELRAQLREGLWLLARAVSG